MKLCYYFLEGRKIVRTSDVNEFGRCIENIAGRTVQKTRIGVAEVSTVFVGIDHNFSSSGPPLLFETMIFGGEHDEYQERYSTWEEAEEGHERAVAKARAGWR